jgi:hypothetical protein
MFQRNVKTSEKIALSGHGGPFCKMSANGCVRGGLWYDERTVPILYSFPKILPKTDNMVNILRKPSKNIAKN